MSDLVTAPNASRFEPLPPAQEAVWARFVDRDRTYFPNLVGLRVEEVRAGYARMRLPWRAELEQPAGVMHGGAIATLVDTVVVPAVGGAYPERPRMLTLTMTVQYLSALAGEDAVAEGWVERRGRSIVFCRAEVLSASGEPVASGTLVYRVSFRPEPVG